MAPVHLEPRHKRNFMASGNNRGQKRYLLASPQYVSVLDPRQNEENDRGKKPLLHWCILIFLIILYNILYLVNTNLTRWFILLNCLFFTNRDNYNTKHFF